MNKIRILIVSQFPNERIKKIVLALKYTNNYEISLYCCEKGDEDYEYNELFDQIYFVTFLDRFINLLKLKSIFYKIPFILRKGLYKVRDIFFPYNIKRSIKIFENMNYKMIYAFDASGKNLLPSLVIKNTILPVIYDSYDMASFYGMEVLKELHNNDINQAKKELELEKYCLENATAYIMKNPQNILKYYRDKGYKISNKFLYFADYCEPKYFKQINFDKQINFNNLKCTFIGPVRVEGSYMSPLFKSTNINSAIQEMCSQKIKTYIYTTTIHNNICKYCYFKQHQKLGQLHTNLVQYDFGINTLSSHIDYDSSNRFTNQNKLANYLEAGLPMISFNCLRHVSDIVTKYNIGITIDYNNIKSLTDEIKSTNYNTMLSNIEKVRNNEYNLYKNAPRLDKFIKDIIGNKN